ncbi:hypothetical protein LOTGIDRAFT_206275 [Lottia gigantea]|uniref:Proline dehydrogenase n=1 Tax=Lottia gigantea TaxID=225164 RepID=V4A0T0_LOTGI|nr:hypothetical protein LOTGIDRAFT_206275 [Lottia gigantea]ESO97408.1 hypothetical protein LOTGIDRAFT_206275 [Lottia gigantea]
MVLLQCFSILLKWSQKVFGKTLFRSLMKATFYGHFVAGENQEMIKPLITQNRQFGVKAILDYSVEKDMSSDDAKKAEMLSCVSEDQPKDLPETGEVSKFRAHEEFGDRREKVTSARTYIYEDEAHCDENCKIFLEAIDAVSASTNSSGLAAIKLTALGRPQLLLQLSEVLVTIRNFFELFAGKDCGVEFRKFKQEDMAKTLDSMGISLNRAEWKEWFRVLDTDNDGEIDLLDWDNLLAVNTSLSKLFIIPNLKTCRLEALTSALTDTEEEQMKNMLKRINSIAQYAKEKDSRIMIDAEQTYFQPAICRLTMELMRKFNTEKAVVFNTYQCYLKQAFKNIALDMAVAQREDFYFGAKLVRGAYMEQERERASALGYEDPINETYEKTTEMYHSILEEIMKQINIRERGKIAIMVATHNEDTVRYTVELMKRYGISPKDRLICFGQLLGMCDHISFPLGQAGYSVYKYVPYGPVEDVLPYLSRRASENSGMLKKVQKEKKLLGSEIKRRIKCGEMLYKPQDHIPSSVMI